MTEQLPSDQCCFTCALWKKEAAQDKAGRVRRDKAALCLWQSTEPYPTSVRQYGISTVRPQPGWVRRDDGKQCPVWRPR